MEELYKKYNFPSVAKFKQILKLNDVKATNKEIEEFIKNKNVNQLHKPVITYKRNLKFITALEPFEMLQIDLLDYQKYSKTNKGFKFILIGIDIFTRFGYAEPIKDKTPSNVLEAFKKFDIKNLNSVYHDSGNEFKNVFLQYLNENNIANFTAEIGDHNSLGVVDRFSKTLKHIIAKYMTANETTKYYEELPKIIEIYNSTPHNSLNNLSPKDTFNGEGYKMIKIINQAKQIYNKSLDDKQKNKIQIGDYVRVKLTKSKFKKGYEITYSKEIYEVKDVSGNKLILDDGSTTSVNNVILTNKDEKQLNTNEIDEANKQASVKRKLLKEGLDID